MTLRPNVTSCSIAKIPYDTLNVLHHAFYLLVAGGVDKFIAIRILTIRVCALKSKICQNSGFICVSIFESFEPTNREINLNGNCSEHIA